MNDIIEMILNNTNVAVEAIIPKPQNNPCIILYIQKDNENHFLKYSTGNSGKIISKVEFIGTYQRLLENNNLTRQWYNENFQTKAKNSPCNFTTIGGIFIMLGIAHRFSKGCYQLVQQ